MKRRITILRVLVAIAVVVTLLLWWGIPALLTRVAARLPSKENARHGRGMPQPSTAAEPILQLEDHTCGFLALSSAYSKYGLSPDEENLRFRLGVNRPANPLQASSTGTLHPDIFRVLMQDHFGYELFDPTDAETPRRLEERLGSGHVLLLLIARRSGAIDRSARLRSVR